MRISFVNQYYCIKMLIRISTMVDMSRDSLIDHYSNIPTRLGHKSILLSLIKSTKRKLWHIHIKKKTISLIS